MQYKDLMELLRLREMAMEKKKGKKEIFESKNGVNSLQIVTFWVITSETNSRGVFRQCNEGRQKRKIYQAVYIHLIFEGKNNFSCDDRESWRS